MDIAVRQLITDFSRSGLLVVIDPGSIKRVRDKLSTYPVHTTTTPLVKAALHAIYTRVLTTTDAQIAHEKRRVAGLITSHPRYRRLMDRWDDQIYLALFEEFKTIAPESYLRELLRYDATNRFNSGTITDPPLTSAELLAKETRARAAIKAIPYGLDFAKKVIEAIRDAADGDRSFVTMRVGAIADIEDAAATYGLDTTPPDISNQLHFGFRSFTTEADLETARYRAWYEMTHVSLHLAPALIPHFRHVFPLPALREYELDGEIKKVVELAGAFLANFYEVYPDHVAEDLILPILAEFLRHMPGPHKSADYIVRKWLWGVAYDMASGGWSLPAYLAQGLSLARRMWAWLPIPIGVTTVMTSLLSSIGVAIYNVVDKVGEVIFTGLNSVLVDQYQWLTEYFYLSRLFLSVFLPEQRRRPKAVWALLFSNDFVRLSPGEKFLMGCELMREPRPVADYASWARERLEALRDLGLDIETEPLIPIRGFAVPSHPFVPDNEIADLAPLMPPNRQVNEIAKEFTERLIAKGAPRGMDGMWFSTTERIAASIRRYSTEIPPVDDMVTTKTLMAAHALADKYPTMYRGAEPLTPAAALRKIKLNDYSPGLPFIPRFRTRKDLDRVGIWAATAKVAEDLLRRGEHPGECAHCFVKSQVVKLQKLLDEIDGLRTVTAATLLSNVIQFVSTVEVTRRQPPLDAFIMNAVPRSEGGFRPFYDRLRECAAVFAADVTKFDSQLIPTVIDALVELRAIGYDGSLVRPIAESQIRASYMAMKTATLVDLRTGLSFSKHKGLLTGQGNTSPDNRDAFRIVIIAAWSIVTGRPPASFWDKNVIGNAGDDDAIGTDEPEIWPAVIDVIRSQFGMQVRVENEGFESLALVGLRVGPVPAHSVKYYRVNGYVTPAYSIMADARSLLHKRTDWLMKTSSAPSEVRFLMQHLDGIIGSAYQAAHLIDVYELLGEQYLTEVSQVLLRFYDKVTIEKTLDEEERTVAFFVHLGSERPRYAGKTDNIRKWLKSHRFPAYNDIMRIWLRPQDIQNTKMAKDHRKLLTWNPTIPYQERVLYGLLDLRQKMYTWIPNHVARALPEFKGVDPTFGMRNPDYVIEKFVWLSLYERNGKRVPPVATFRTRLRENPYGSACDPVGFLSWLTNDDNLFRLTNADLEAYRAQMLAITGVYWFIENFFKIFKSVPGLAILYHLYAFTTRDVNRLYAALNYVHMLATGASSSVISNMMPPDPYAWMKRFAVIMTYIVPRVVYKALTPGLKYLMTPVPLIVELWAAGDAAIAPRPLQALYNQLEVPRPWADVVGQLMKPLQDPADVEPLLVTAPTGTGKSTGFLASLVYNGCVSGNIWLLTPTIISRDIYENDFLPAGYFQILATGVPNRPEARVKVLTYGHARNRVPIEGGPNDVIVLDEIHKGDVEMMACYFKFQEFKRILITATVTPFMPIPTRRFAYPGERRFEVQDTVVNCDFPTLVEEIMSIDAALMSRALIICPDLGAVEDIIQTLARVSLTGWELSSNNPIPNATGILVATTIVDQAVTILPPPTCLIDLGLTLEVEYDFTGFMAVARPRQVATSPYTKTQRLGRVGRSGHGRAFSMSIAGTGSEIPPRPTPFALLDDPSLVNNLLGWYHISVAVESVNDASNIFRYFSIANDTDASNVAAHTVATAFYILARHSDYQFGEPLWLEWLSLRLERSHHEILNIIIDNVIDLGFGDPLLGDFEVALRLVEGGNFTCRVGGRHIACSGLCIINSTILYCGAAQASLLALAPSVQHYAGLYPSNFKFWRDYNTVTHLDGDIDDVHIATGIDESVVTPVNLLAGEHRQTEKKFDTGLAAMIATVREQVAPKPGHRKGELVRVFINTDTVLTPERHTCVIVTNYHLTLFTVQQFSTVPYGLGPSFTDVGIVSSLACGYHDDVIIVYGPVPTRLIAGLRSMLNPGFITGPCYDWLVISPRYARGFAHGLQQARRAGEESAFLLAIPKRVLLDSRLTRYDARPSEVKVFLNQSGHLAGIM